MGEIPLLASDLRKAFDDSQALSLATVRTQPFPGELTLRPREAVE